MKETARVPPLLDSPQSAAPETFLSRDAVSAFPLPFEPLPQPLPGVGCPGWDAPEQSPWRFCVSSSPLRSGRGGRPIFSLANGSQSLPHSAANRDSCAYRAARPIETKTRAQDYPARALKSPNRRSLHPPAATSDSPPLRRSSKILRAPEPPSLRIPSAG